MSSDQSKPGVNQDELRDEFTRIAKGKQPGVFAEFLDFLRHNKKWWITPILLVLFLIGMLIALTASPIAPFIYPFF